MRKLFTITFTLIYLLLLPQFSYAGVISANIWMLKKGAKSYVKFIEWLSPLTGSPFKECADNSDPNTDSCIVGLGCVINTNSTPAGIGAMADRWAIIEGYKLTDAQIAATINSISGKELGNSGSNGYCGFDIYDKYLGTGPFLYVAAKNNGVWVSGTTYSFSVRTSAPNSTSATCNVNPTNLDINFGEVKLEEANEKAFDSSFGIHCTGSSGFAKITAPTYPDDGLGLPLNPDRTLFAKVMVANYPVEIGGFIRIPVNTTVDIPVQVKLKTTNKLKGGFFNSSLVLNIDYF